MGRTPVRDVEFADYAAGLVEALMEEARVLTGTDCIYEAAGQVRAALQPGGQGSKAVGVFVLIQPTANGATVRRPVIPTSGDHSYNLTGTDYKRIVAAMKRWYEEVLSNPTIAEDE